MNQGQTEEVHHALDTFLGNREPMLESSQEAKRAVLEGEDGSVTEAGYFGPPDLQRFGVTHLPRDPNGAGVVICSPLGAELLRNNRREVVLSRQLAEAGFAVQRFHYVGAGHSDGSRQDITVESMIEDTRLAAGHLVDRAGSLSLGFMGTRLGAMAAAEASNDSGGPLAMWEPSPSGNRYFRDLLRALLMVEMGKVEEGSKPRTTKDLAADLEATGTLDVAGFSIDWPLFADARGRELADMLEANGRSVHLIQMARSDKLRAGYQKLVEKWQADGATVAVELVDHEEAWWFHVDLFRSEEERDYAKQMFDSTVSFFSRSIGALSP